MIPVRSKTILLGLALCVAASACSAATGASNGPGTSPATSPSTRAAWADSARSAYTPADVDFMRGMIHHHSQALVMARMAPTHDASPSLRRLAARILNGQETEIALMQDWLRDRGEPVPEPPAAGTAYGQGDPGPITGWDAGPQMAGILSDEQMARLDAARGTEFDRLFLQYMIRHHDGAVDMVDELMRTRGSAREEALFRLASGIRVDQATEIARMKKMLRELLLEDPR